MCISSRIYLALIFQIQKLACSRSVFSFELADHCWYRRVHELGQVRDRLALLSLVIHREFPTANVLIDVGLQHISLSEGRRHHGHLELGHLVLGQKRIDFLDISIFGLLLSSLPLLAPLALLVHHFLAR